MRKHTTMAIVVFATIACRDEPAAPTIGLTPIVHSAVVAPNEANVLSAIVSARTHDADSVAVRFRLVGASDAADSVTPAVRAVVGRATIPVLGLLPESEYQMRVVAHNSAGVSVGQPVAFTTGALPQDLPIFTATAADARPGYVALASGKYGLVIDNTGRVVWYRHFENGLWLNFMAQTNGRYVTRLVTTDPTDIEPWVELDALGRVTRSLGCHLGLQPRFHDILTQPSGDYWILCDETRTMDLRQYGGAASARVMGTAVQHIGEDGVLKFHWTPFDHFYITDVDSATRAGLSVNWTHGNSLDLDRDGNLLVSFRNLNEITNIDTKSGLVRWRLGGRRNQFTLTADTRTFAGQHSVRALPSGEILLLDNVGDSLESRVERWALDPVAQSASMTASYGSIPRVRTLIGGSVQSLSTSRTLVSFGTEGRVEEYDADGTVRWRIEGSPGYVFRAQRFPSLYRPGVGAR